MSKIEHVYHGGNFFGVVDGVFVLFVASFEYVWVYGFMSRVWIRMSAVVGTEFVIMLTVFGFVACCCVEKVKMIFDDIDLFEVNEVFVLVVFKFLRDIGVLIDKVNVNGGVMVFGYFIGVIGGMFVGILIDELERWGLGIGFVIMCIGGGMGMVTIIERI